MLLPNSSGNSSTECMRVITEYTQGWWTDLAMGTGGQPDGYSTVCPTDADGPLSDEYPSQRV